MLILGLFRELLPLLTFGYFLGRFKPELSNHIARPLIKIGIPISLSGLLLKSGLDWHLFEALLMALFAIGLLLLGIGTIPKIKSLIFNRSLILGSAFGNSGYFGIPVCLALLPSDALSFSIGFDLGATLLIWTLGPILLSSSPLPIRSGDFASGLVKTLTRSPATKGLLGALVIQLTPWTQVITSAIWLPSRVVICLALMVVGIRLSSLTFSNKPANRDLLLLISPSLLIKLFILPALMFALSIAFSLPSLMRNALVLQAATPTAVSVLLLAEASGKEQNIAAFLVTSSTLMAIFTVPLWSIFLR